MSKTIDFTVKADGVYTALEKIQQKSKAMFDNEVEQAQKYSKNLKEQLKLLEEKAKLLDKASRGASQNVTDFTSTNNPIFNENKKKRLSAIDAEQEEIRESRQALGKALHDKEINLPTFQKNLAELNLESTSLSRERGNVVTSTFKDTDEYKTLKEIEKSSKLTSTSFRENIDLTRTSGKDLAKAIVIGDKDVADEIRESAPSRTLTEQLAQSEIEDKKKREGPESKSGGIGELVSGMMALQMAEKFVGTAAQFSNTKNGFDQIANVRKTEGEIIGGVVGAVLGAVVGGYATGGVGAVTAAGIGANAGSSIVGTLFGAAGDLEQKGSIGTQELEDKYYRRKALTGQNYSVGSRSNLGYDFGQTLDLQMGMARSMGTSQNVERQTDLSVFYEKGFGVQQSTAQTLEELLRSSKEGDKDIGNILGGILKEGQGNLFKNGDRTFFNEFLQKNYTTLQRELLKGQTSVSSGTTLDTLLKFNSLGGPFAAKDFRSMGLISQIDNSLTNPGDDVSKARNFQVLRRLHPNFNIEQLKEEQDKGFGSSGYFQGVIDDVKNIGGDKAYQILNLSGRLNVKAFEARRLLEGGVNFKNLSQKDLKSGMTDGYLEKNAENFTNEIDKATAQVTEGVLQGFIKGSKVAGKVIEEALGSINVTVVNGKAMVGIKENITHTSDGRPTEREWRRQVSQGGN
jgi:hypothetical protein